MAEYELTYTGIPDSGDGLNVELRLGDEVIATGGGFADVDAAKEWALVQARAHDAELNPPEPVSGSHKFTL